MWMNRTNMDIFSCALSIRFLYTHSARNVYVKIVFKAMYSIVVVVKKKFFFFTQFRFILIWNSFYLIEIGRYSVLSIILFVEKSPYAYMSEMNEANICYCAHKAAIKKAPVRTVCIYIYIYRLIYTHIMCVRTELLMYTKHIKTQSFFFLLSFFGNRNIIENVCVALSTPTTTMKS